MQIFNSLEEININDKTAVALGNFDGIHIGHKIILDSALEASKEKGIKSLCYTFSNHPFNFIMNRDENDPDGIKLICTEEQKIRMLEEMGFDILVNVPFDEDMMKMSAIDFIEKILIGRLNTAVVCVGFNYTFGARAMGKPAMLKEAGEEHGFEVNIHDAVILDDKVVSSTLIRETIADGNMDMTARYLGREYVFEGTVEHGNRIGGSLGFPTANLSAPVNRALPPNGVYFGHTVLDGKTYKSISNIGLRPTVTDASRKTIETHIFDFDGDCYGKVISVSFEHFHRPESKFADREALHRQIADDCEKARNFK